MNGNVSLWFSPETSSLLEGPLWDPLSGFWCVDINQQTVWKISDLTQEEDSRRLTVSGATALCRSSAGIQAVSRHGLTIVGPSPRRDVSFGDVDGPVTSPLMTEPNGRTNDAKVGFDGALWVGTMTDPPTAHAGKLFRLLYAHGSIRCTIIRDRVTISNGIAWTHEPFGFYYIDTPTHVIDFAHVRGDEVVFEPVMAVPEVYGDPDGMTIGLNGLLFVAMWGGAKVLVINPTRQEIADVIPIPAKYVTSCIFGGPEYDVLYVTTATWEAAGESDSQPADDLGGSVLAVTGVGKGKAEPVMNLIS